MTDLYLYGARNALWAFFTVLCAGALSLVFRSRLLVLLAVLLMKPDGSDRPIGVSCALRRCAGRMMVQQDKAAINDWYTKQWPSKLAAQQQEVTAAVSALEAARANLATAVDGAGTSADAVGALAADVTSSQAHLDAVSAPRRYPVNFAFDSDGAQRFALTAALYHDKYPRHVIGNDDIKN